MNDAESREATSARGNPGVVPGIRESESGGIERVPVATIEVKVPIGIVVVGVRIARVDLEKIREPVAVGIRAKRIGAHANFVTV